MLYFSKAENERVSRVGHEETIQKLDSCPRNRDLPIGRLLSGATPGFGDAEADDRGCRLGEQAHGGKGRRAARPAPA